MGKKHFWGYRIDNDNTAFFYDELVVKNQLRQGWGYNESQNLMNDTFVDDGARRNKPIYEKVKKGDILIIPHMPNWDSVVLAEATEDFDTGYRFEIFRGNYKEKRIDDYGHIFPARYLLCFSKQNINVGANLKSTLKCFSRFWNADRCEQEIQQLLALGDGALGNAATTETGWQSAVDDAFGEAIFADKIYDALKSNYQGAEWETVLRQGFEKILPDNVVVETTWNVEEKKHGCDIFIKIPGIFQTTYVIAVQVKDYKGVVSESVVDQINKVDTYMKVYYPDAILIDKYIIIIDADEIDNAGLCEAAKASKVKVIFRKELKTLLSRMAKTFIGDSGLLTVKR